MSSDPATPDRSRQGLGFPLAVAAGAAGILALVILAMVLFSVNRDKEFMSRILLAKGAAIIRALEAGTRTGMRGGFGTGVRIQHLLEEMSGQEDLFYIAVTDDKGRILAHGDRGLIGARLLEPGEIGRLAPEAGEKWRLVEEDSGRASFLVYRRFLPERKVEVRRRGPQGPPGMPPPPDRFMPPPDRFTPPPPPPASGGPDAGPGPDLRSGLPVPPGSGGGPGQGGRRGPPRGHPPDPPFFCAEDRDEAGAPLPLSGRDLVIFVGMDVTPFEEARARDIRQTVIAAAVLLVFGLCGVLALFAVQRYRAQRRQLGQARAFAAEMVAGMPAGLVLVGPDGRVAMVNAEAERLCRVSGAEAVGRAAAEVLPEAVLDLAGRAGEGGEEEMEAEFGDGPPVSVAVSVARVAAEDGAEVGMLYLLRDRTEVRRLEAEVRRREKLAAVGSLAAGVAHEIRNPLSSIRGFATFLGRKFPEGSEDRQAAEIMVHEVDRLNRVISELIEFARPSELRPAPARLSDVAAHALRLARTDAGAGGVVIDDSGLSATPETVLDADRMSQALLNLFLNAVQASPSGAVVRVRSGRDGERVFVETLDQGRGIEPDNLKKIFDPYFTTKAKGTGLGLAVAQKIVTAHGGEITVDSAPGRGSRFLVTLPPLPPGPAEAPGYGDPDGPFVPTDPAGPTEPRDAPHGDSDATEPHGG